jgi:hypothetical protein
MFQMKDIVKLSQAWITWNNSDKQLRFGQYVMNTYYPHASCRSVYYEQDAKTAYNLLFEHIVLGNDIDDWIER